jgi:hypothetical protein
MSSGFGLRGIFRPFTIIGPSKTDHMQSRQSWGEYQHVKFLAYQSQHLESLLSVVLPSVHCNERSAPIHSECKTKRNSPLSYVPGILGRVKGYKHLLYCTHINARGASPVAKTPLKKHPERRHLS